MADVLFVLGVIVMSILAILSFTVCFGILIMGEEWLWNMLCKRFGEDDGDDEEDWR